MLDTSVFDPLYCKLQQMVIRNACTPVICLDVAAKSLQTLTCMSDSAAQELNISHLFFPRPSAIGSEGRTVGQGDKHSSTKDTSPVSRPSSRKAAKTRRTHTFVAKSCS